MARRWRGDVTAEDSENPLLADMDTHQPQREAPLSEAPSRALPVFGCSRATRPACITKGLFPPMIIKEPNPEEVCDLCTLPLETGYIKWVFPRKNLFLHEECAYSYASRLRNHAYQFRRLQERLQEKNIPYAKTTPQ